MHYYLKLHTLSFVRLRRRLTPVGHLWHENILRLLYVCYLFIGGVFLNPAAIACFPLYNKYPPA